MAHLGLPKKILLAIAIAAMTACGQTQQQPEKAASNPMAEAQALKVIEPAIGPTPDISDDARKNLQRQKELFAKIDSVVSSYPDYETAKQHLTKRQIEIYENEEEYSKEDHLDVSKWGCSWYCGGGPDSIFASSVLPPNKKLNYVANNAHDFSLRTAWIEGVAGHGVRESITFRFAKNSPPVTTVEIYNGYMKSDKVWQENGRVKQFKLYVNNKPYALLNLKDIKSKQIFAIDTLQGTDADLYLRFEITEVYPGDKYDDVAVSEIEFDGIGVHCFAKGTLVSTPEGAIAIEKLKVGDKVFSLNEQTSQIETSTILAVASQKHHNLYELDFAGVKITATDDHPFFYDNTFYAIRANNHYGPQSEPLRIGQCVHFLVGQNLVVRRLTAIRRLDACEMTYTISRLDRNSVFFANGACVLVEDRTAPLAVFYPGR